MTHSHFLGLPWLRTLSRIALIGLLFGARQAQAEAEEQAPATISDEMAWLAEDFDLDLKVSVASKRLEPIRTAPGIVTAYSAETIQAYGLSTLAELADVTAGYSSTTLFGERVLETRGERASGFDNDKHLLLIDGIPVYHARNNRVSVDEELPIYFANSVEFLKGPGSALYGGGAFSGVINIHTKNPTLGKTLAESKTDYSGPLHQLRVGFNLVQADQHSQSKLMTGYFRRNPSGAFVGDTERDTKRNWDNQESLFLNLAHEQKQGGLRGTRVGLVFLSKRGSIGESWLDVSHRSNRLLWRSVISYLKFNRELMPGFSLNAYLKGNWSQEKGRYVTRSTTENANSYDKKFPNVEALMEASVDFSDTLIFTIGMNYDLRREEQQSVVHGVFSQGESGAFHTTSVYAQLQETLPFLAGLGITAGARVDVGIAQGNRYAQVSPRLSAVQKLGDNVTLKLLWGSGMKAPGIKSIRVNREEVPADLGAGFDTSADVIPELVAETVQTAEASLVVHSTHVSATLTGYYREIKNALAWAPVKLVPIGEDAQTVIPETVPSIYVNGETPRLSFGGEAELWLRLNPNISFFANASTAALNADSSVTDIPTFKLNAGGQYRWGTLPLRMSLIVRHIDGFSSPSLSDELYDGFTMLDGLARYEPSNSLAFQLQVKNLTNTSYQLPFGNEPNVYVPGRTVFVTVEASF